jgi:hypothetical protein
MTIQSSFDKVDGEFLGDYCLRNIISDRSASSDEVVFQVPCSRIASLKIIGPRCVHSCLSFGWAIGSTIPKRSKEGGELQYL